MIYWSVCVHLTGTHYHTHISGTHMSQEDIKFLSQQMKNKKKKWNDGENHSVAVSDPKIVKKKDVSNGENLFEVPKDETLDILLGHF